VNRIRENLRKNTLKARDQMAASERALKSEAASQQLLSLPAFQRAVNIFVYISYRSELATLGLVEHCLARPDCQISVPLTIINEGLEAYLIRNLAEDLAPGYCGIPEPLPAKTEKFDPGLIDLVILPGSVFDLQGGRLGYGGGYYDRFLVNDAPQAIRIGVAFESQLVDEVPMLAHDQRLDYLVTEKRAVKISRVP